MTMDTPTLAEAVERLRAKYDEYMLIEVPPGRPKAMPVLLPDLAVVLAAVERLGADESDAANLRRMMNSLAGDLHDGTTPYQTLDEVATVIEYLMTPQYPATHDAGHADTAGAGR